MDIESRANWETYTSECNYDYLAIHDGHNESDFLLGKYCAPMSHGKQFEVNYTDTYAHVCVLFSLPYND